METENKLTPEQQIKAEAEKKYPYLDGYYLKSGLLVYTETIGKRSGYVAAKLEDYAHIEKLEKEIEQEWFNHSMTRVAWDRTTEDRDDLRNQAKALSAIKKGMEASISEQLARIAELEKENERLREAIKEINKWLNWTDKNIKS